MTHPTADVLRNAVSGIPDIAVAFVYGSVARGDADDQSDCDLFVLTVPGTSVEGNHAVVRALAVQNVEISRAIGRELSLVVYRTEDLRRRLADVPGGFVDRVLSGPKIFVLGTAEDLQGLTSAAPRVYGALNA